MTHLRLFGKEMNSYSDILKPAKTEVDDFATSPKGKSWDDDWFESLKRRIEIAIEAPDDSVAENQLDAIGWIIVDSGPLGEGFVPSIDKALDAMQRARKRRFKAKREAEQGGAGQRR